MGNSCRALKVKSEFNLLQTWSLRDAQDVVLPFVATQLRSETHLPCCAFDIEQFTALLQREDLLYAQTNSPSTPLKDTPVVDIQASADLPFVSYVTALQAHARRHICLRRLRRWFMHPGESTESIRRLFACFRKDNTANPYDGNQTVDAHEVLVAVLLLCSGKAKEKLSALFELFALEKRGEQSMEELVVMLIVCSNSVKVFVESSEDADYDFDYEAFAYSVAKSSLNARITIPVLLRMMAQEPQFGPWIDLFSSDCDLAIFELCQRQWNVLISSSCLTDNRPEDFPDTEGWIAVLSKTDSDRMLDWQRLDCNTPRSFVVCTDTRQESLIYLRACRDDQASVGPLYDVGPSKISFKLPQQHVGYSAAPLLAHLRVSTESSWSNKDWVGLFEAKAPLGKTSAFVSKRVYYGSLQRRYLTLEPLPHERNTRLIRFLTAPVSYSWRDLSVVAYGLPGRSRMLFETGSNILIRVGGCACKTQVGLCCEYRLGRVLSVQGKARKLSARLSGSDTVASVAFDDARRLAHSGTMDFKNGDRLICADTRDVYRLCEVIYSGRFELRYVDQSGIVRARSEIFEIMDSPFRFEEFKGGDLENKLECSYYPAISMDILQGAKLSIVGHNSSETEELPATIDQTLQRAVFDPYYAKLCHGGLYQFRLRVNGKIAAESNFALVSPILSLVPREKTIVRNRLLKQKLVCILKQVKSEPLWSNWDVVELFNTHKECCVGFKYIQWPERSAGVASIPLSDEIPAGTYFWSFRGKSISCLRSETFEIIEDMASYEVPKSAEAYAVLIQKVIRSFIARKKFLEVKYSAEEATRSLRAELERAIKAYEDRRAANTKRNPVLLSMRDKVAEKKAKKKVESLERQIVESSGINRDLTNEESARILAIQGMELEERLMREWVEGLHRESMRREQKRLSIHTICKPLGKPDEDLDFCEELRDVNDWCMHRDTPFTDKEFPPTAASLGDRFQLETVQWRRISECATLRPFPETIYLLDLCPKEEFLDALATALVILLLRGDRLHRLLNFEHAERGVWQILSGDESFVILDDWVPGVIEASTGEWVPLLSNLKNGSAVLMLAKALAKMEGNYSLLTSGSIPPEEILARFYKGFFRSFEPPPEHDASVRRIIDDESQSRTNRLPIMERNRGHIDTLLQCLNRLDIYVVFGQRHGCTFVVLRREYADGENILQLFTPFNVRSRPDGWQWDGAWSANSSKWTDEIKSKLEYDTIDDGTFWMSAKDFLIICTNWGYTLVSPPRYPATEIVLDFPNCLSTSWLIQNSEACDIYIQVLQMDGERQVETRVDVRTEDGYATDYMILHPGVRSQTLAFSAPEFEVAVQSWLPGISYKVLLRIYGGKLTTQENEGSWQPVMLPPADVCAGCLSAITSASVSLRGILWHPGCFGCCKCIDNFGMSHTSPSYPIQVLTYLYESARLQALCGECWKESGYSPLCDVCGEHEDIQGRCASCDLEDAVANAEKCIQCNGPLLALNDWSGEVLTKAAGTIHVECESDYRIASAPKCGACNLPVLKGNGFSGKARRTRKGLVHLECMHKV